MIDPVPLVVDLDGTLIDGDTLHLSLRVLARTRPWLVPTVPFMVLRGRAGFKEFVSRHVFLDPARLPYRDDVVEFVKRERTTGRRVLLATAANRQVADAVAAHLGLFDEVVASDGGHNARAPAKWNRFEGSSATRTSTTSETACPTSPSSRPHASRTSSVRRQLWRKRYGAGATSRPYL